jgi:hypothetical protein
VALPLIKKLRKNAVFSWDANDEKIFFELRAYLVREPILKLPNFSLPFIVTTDACKDGLAAVLTQRYED